MHTYMTHTYESYKSHIRDIYYDIYEMSQFHTYYICSHICVNYASLYGHILFHMYVVICVTADIYVNIYVVFYMFHI